MSLRLPARGVTDAHLFGYKHPRVRFACTHEVSVESERSRVVPAASPKTGICVNFSIPVWCSGRQPYLLTRYLSLMYLTDMYRTKTPTWKQDVAPPTEELFSMETPLCQVIVQGLFSHNVLER